MKVSVEIDDGARAKLDTLRAAFERKNSTTDRCVQPTNAAIFRAGLDALWAAHRAVCEGCVVGVARGPGQRLRRVIVSGTSMRVRIHGGDE